MKNGALTLALLVVTGAAGGLAFAGCGGEDPPETVTPADTGTAVVDSGPGDTKMPDTNPADTAPIRCDQPVGADYTCPAAPSKAGATVCTDTALNEILTACFGSAATATTCGAWQKKYPDCDKCALNTWLFTTEDGRGFLDYPACMQKVDPASGCGVAGNCWNDCRETVCGECDDTERSACETRARRSSATDTVPKGSCYENSYKKYNECTKDPKFASCITPIEFLRGACRDNGDWTNAKIDKSGGDAGTDGAVLPDVGLPEVAVDALGD
jgi:hypothetical protein